MNRINNILKCVSFALLLYSAIGLQALVIGSDVLVSLQPLANFPLSDLDNTMEGFAWFKSGFTIGASTSSCVYDSVFPVSGPVTMNGGTLTLQQDLVFNDITTLNSLGTIIGNNHYISFPTSVTSIPTNIFQNCVVYINNDISLSSTLTFSGTCILNGNGHTINLSSGTIALASGATLTIFNTTLKGISGTNIQCADNTSTLNLNNITWAQNNNYTLSHGNINISNQVNFLGNEIFSYKSTGTFTVLSQATLTLDNNITFSYDTTSANQLQFIDNSSTLILQSNGLLHATINGLHLTKGTMYVTNNSAVGSEVWVVNGNTIDNGITVGDCRNGANDFICNVGNGVTFSIDSGSFNYENINSSSWNMGDNLSALFVAANTSLNSYQPMNMGNSITTFGNNATLGQAPNAPFNGSVVTQGTLNTPTLPNC